MGGEKVACWSKKATISLKRVKVEEKLLWAAYRNSPFTNALSNVTIPIPYGTSSPRLGVRNPHLKSKTPSAIISGKGKATNFKFCRNIHSIDWNKSPLKISEKVAWATRTQGLSKIFRAPYIGRISRPSSR